MFDPSGQLAKEYFLTAHLLKSFIRHIDQLPRSLREIQSKWEKTYPGQDSDLLERFDEATQLALLENWRKVVARADKCHADLVERINKRAEELLGLRDKVSIALRVNVSSLTTMQLFHARERRP